MVRYNHRRFRNNMRVMQYEKNHSGPLIGRKITDSCDIIGQTVSRQSVVRQMPARWDGPVTRDSWGEACNWQTSFEYRLGFAVIR